MKTDQSNSKWIIVVVLVIIAVGLGYYVLTSGTSDTASVKPSPPVATSSADTPERAVEEEPGSLTSISPISPISPVSPVGNASVSTKMTSDETQRIINEAILAQDQGNYKRAIELTNTLLNENPDDFIALNIRGSAYLGNGNIEQAMSDYNRAIERNSLFPHAYYNRGRVYNFLKKYDEALADLQKSIDLAPTEFGYRAYGNIGLIYHQQGKYDQALETFDKSISFNKDNRADVYYFRGETYTVLENYEAAIADYRAAIDRFPRYDLALQSLGYAYYKNNQFDQALEALNKALEISPNSPPAHYYLVLVHLAANDIDQAKAEASQAINSLGTLSKEGQKYILTRVLTDLETFAQENPSKAEAVEELINLLPAPHN